MAVAGWFEPDQKTIARIAILVGALGLGQAYWNFGAIMLWQGMLAMLRIELLLHQGPVALTIRSCRNSNWDPCACTNSTPDGLCFR